MVHFLSATALQSLEIASDSILSGKAKVMIAGGFDDISEEGSFEFANMKATSNAEAEFAMGREPTEMSRPATTSRAGVSGPNHCHVLRLTRLSIVYGVTSMSICLVVLEDLLMVIFREPVYILS